MALRPAPTAHLGQRGMARRQVAWPTSNNPTHMSAVISMLSCISRTARPAPRLFKAFASHCQSLGRRPCPPQTPRPFQAAAGLNKSFGCVRCHSSAATTDPPLEMDSVATETDTRIPVTVRWACAWPGRGHDTGPRKRPSCLNHVSASASQEFVSGFYIRSSRAGWAAARRRCSTTCSRPIMATAWP